MKHATGSEDIFNFYFFLGVVHLQVACQEPRAEVGNPLVAQRAVGEPRRVEAFVGSCHEVFSIK